MHIHLDPVGGAAGDMFIAALCDAFPEFKNRIQTLIENAKFPEVVINFEDRNDGTLSGSGFKVSAAEPQGAVHAHEHAYCTSSHSDKANHAHPHSHSHMHSSLDHEDEHRSYSQIQAILSEAPLPEKVREHALAIFKLIGEAEAQVHGVDISNVQFHEVGGWDSVIDVVGAGFIIDALQGSTWSCATLPFGGGYIETAHGKLPVPPPAVSLLLFDFAFHDDGVLGERITPTGAAILKYLKPYSRLPQVPLTLKNVGYGFGTKRFPGMSNVLRVLAFDSLGSEPFVEPISVLNFEIDDMTGEELALSLDQIRNTNGVLDVMQTAGYGKKNRVIMSIQVLVRPECMNSLSKFILSTMTTLGVRHQTIFRSVVPRTISAVELADGTVRVKVADRPDGRRTAKVEIDDIKSGAESCHELRDLANDAETRSLEGTNE